MISISKDSQCYDRSYYIPEFFFVRLLVLELLSISFLQISAKSWKKIYKIEHISKTKNHSKKSFMQKMSVRSIPIFPANVATFEWNWIFGLKLNFWVIALKRDMMWHEILRLSLVSAHCVTFMSRWPLLRAGLHLLSISNISILYFNILKNNSVENELIPR